MLALNMLQFKIFSKITAVAVSVLLVLVASVGAGVIKKRETAATTNDPDIVRNVEPKWEEIVAHTVESENMNKSTRLMPQVSIIGKSEPEVKSSGNLVLNRLVESEGAKNFLANALHKLPEREEISSESDAKSEGVHVDSDGSRVFSYETDAAEDSQKTAAMSNSIKNGLDSSSLETKDNNDSFDLDDAITELVTIENILPDIEKIALNIPSAISSSLGVPSKSDYGRSMLHSNEKFDDDFEATTIRLDTSAIETLATTSTVASVHTDVKYFSTTVAPKLSANSDAPITPLPDLLLPTTMTSDLLNKTAVTPAEIVVTLNSTTQTTENVHENTLKEFNEIRTPSGSVSSEKRAKFINDNSTNAQQLNLPDAAEVWMLAGMKTVPISNGANTERTLNNSIVSSNSEKNLLDWTHIMNADLDAKKYDNLIESSTNFRDTLPTSQILASDMRPTLEHEVSTVVPKLENHTEVVISSTVAPTNETIETVTQPTAAEVITDKDISTSTHLPNIINEVQVETTMLPRIKPDFPPTTMTTSTTAEHVINDKLHTTLEPAAATVPATTLKSTLTADSNTHTDATILSLDNNDNSASSTDIANTISASSATKESAKSAEPENISKSIATIATPILVNTSSHKESKEPETTPTSTTTADETTIVAALPENLSGTNYTETSLSPPASNVARNNEVTLQTHNNNNNENDDIGSDSNVEANAAVSRHATQEHAFSESTTLSQLAASDANTTATERNFTHSAILQNKDDNNDVASETTTTSSSSTTTTPATTSEFPTILARNTNLNTSAPEIGQIGNEVDLDKSIKHVESSTYGTSPKLADIETSSSTTPTTPTTPTTTTTSFANELLISTTTSTTTTPETTTTITTTTIAAATPILEESAAPTTTGSVAENSTAAAAATDAPPLVNVKTGDLKPNEADKNAAHESESSLETNAIDPFDKTSTAKPIIAAATTADKQEKLPVAEQEHKPNSVAEGHDEEILLTQATTTMDTLVLNSTNITTTTDTPLISLLDDTTTTKTATTTTPASISTKIEEIYALFPSTSTESVSNDTTSTSSTTAPATTTPATKAFEATNTIPVVLATTTMLPTPTILHASIGGGSSGTELPTIDMPGLASGNLQPNSADASGTDVNVIIAITVSVIGVVALILLVGFLYLMRKRQKQMSYGQRCRPVSLDDYRLDNVSVGNSLRRKDFARISKRTYGNAAFDDPSLRHNLMSAMELVKWERKLSILEEFRDVPQITARSDEVPPGCEAKNRYANVVPLPETRVVLQQQHGDEKTEYINANYVRGPTDAPNYYIACQAPLETTVTDFWRMIWEQQSRVIIQATDILENGIEKCAEYLPPSVTLDNHATYGDFQVLLKNREVKDKYAISTIMLKNTVTDESRELTHYWYKWPEVGVPSEEAPIIAMLLEVRSSLKTYAIEAANELREKSATLRVESAGGQSTATESAEKEGSLVSGSSNGEINGNVATDKPRSSASTQGPLTIHCSPGTGRTGTIIACDMTIRSLETPKRSVDIPQIVYYVRRGRASAVKTKEQYEFIYKVACMYAAKITNLSNDN